MVVTAFQAASPATVSKVKSFSGDKRLRQFVVPSLVKSPRIGLSQSSSSHSPLSPDETMPAEATTLAMKRKANVPCINVSAVEDRWDYFDGSASLQWTAASNDRALTPSRNSTTWNNKLSDQNFVGTSCCNPSSNEEGNDSQIGTLESTDGHCTYTTGGASAFVNSRTGTALRTMFYFHYEPIQEENESKLSSEGEIRTDVSNDESFVLDLNQYIDFCDEPAEENRCESPSARLRANSH